MDKLRKVGMWFWQNKERMVLVLLVAVFGYRVYKVATEKTEVAGIPAPRPPDTADPTDTRKAPPAPEPTENYQSISQRNPFWYYGSRAEGAGTEGTSEEESIRLLNIQRSPGGGYSAQIQTQVTKWYREGEPFESYTLLKIDPENQLVEVYSGKSGTTLTLTIQ